METVSSLRLSILGNLKNFLALLNSESSLTELSPAQSPRLERRGNVSVQSPSAAACTSHIMCRAPHESFWSSIAQLWFRLWGVSENTVGFAFSLSLSVGASPQRKAPNPHSLTWLKLPVLQPARSTLSCSGIICCCDYNTKYSGIQIKLLTLAGLEQQPVLHRLAFVLTPFYDRGRDSPTFDL